MIETLPPAAVAALKENVPLIAAPKVKFWWVRGVVLDVQQTERPTPKPDKDNPHGRLRDLVLKIGDVDNPQDGYDVRLEGVHHEVEAGDVVSLLGHELTDAEQVTTPRLFLNHNTDAFTRAYPIATRLPYGFVPILQRKQWLSARLPVAPSPWVGVAMSCGLYIGLPLFFVAAVLSIILSRSLAGLVLLAYLSMGAVLLIPGLVAFAASVWYQNWVISQPRFSFEQKLPSIFFQNIFDFGGYLSHDMTAAYERLALVVQAEVLKNPAPDLDFVPVARGIETVGKLSENKPVAVFTNTGASVPVT